MQYDTIQLDPPAATALDSLRQPVRGAVWSEIIGLINDPVPRANVREAHFGKAQYVLVPEADPSLRVFFRTDDSNRVVEIVDLIRPEALLSIMGGGAKSASAQ